jgi:hypothetical protein
MLGCTENARQTNDNPPFNQDLYERAQSQFQQRHYASAATLLEPLAKQGHAESQYALGYLLYHGYGIEQDPRKAMHWFKQAADQGHPKAIQALERIKRASADAQKNAGTSTEKTSGVLDLRNHQATQSSEPGIIENADDDDRMPPASVRQSSTDQPTVPPIQSSTSHRETQTTVTTDKQPGHSRAEAPDAPPASASKATAKIPADEEQSAEWILQQPARHFTIQLSSSTHRSSTLNFIRQLALDGVYFFKYDDNGAPRYTVIHGSFASYSQAKQKLQLLQERGYKQAWIRNMNVVQDLLRGWARNN